jgi:hypothetical protein
MLIALAAPSLATAQIVEDGFDLDEPAPRYERARGIADDTAVAPAPTSRDRSGWGTFGGHVGFFAGVAGTAGLVLAALDDPSLQPLVGPGGLTLTIGLTALGAWRVSVWAESGDWDPIVGWGFAGALPGAMAGMVGAGGALMAIDASPSLAARLGALGAGVALGATAGYLGFRAMAHGRGNAGWEIFSFWVGFFVTEVFALVAAGGNATSTETGLALLTIPAGAALSATVVHLLLR